MPAAGRESAGCSRQGRSGVHGSPERRECPAADVRAERESASTARLWTCTRRRPHSPLRHRHEPLLLQPSHPTLPRSRQLRWGESRVSPNSCKARNTNSNNSTNSRLQRQMWTGAGPPERRELQQIRLVYVNGSKHMQH